MLRETRSGGSFIQFNDAHLAEVSGEVEIDRENGRGRKRGQDLREGSKSGVRMKERWEERERERERSDSFQVCVVVSEDAVANEKAVGGDGLFIAIRPAIGLWQQRGYGGGGEWV